MVDDVKKPTYWFCDVLTCLGLIGVFACHVTNVLRGYHIIAPTANVIRLAETLQYFVILFFILSGFKLTSSILYEKEAGTFSYPRYLLKRFLRLWPLYSLAIIAYLIFRYFLKAQEWASLNWWSYLENFLFLQGFDPVNNNTVVAGGWFLGALWIYEVLCPFLVQFTKSTERSLYLLGGAFLLRYLLSLTYNFPWFGLEAGVWDDYLVHNFVSVFPYFYLGICAYFLTIKKDFRFRWWDLFMGVAIIVYFLLVEDEWNQAAVVLFFFFLVMSLFRGERTKNLRVVPFLSTGALGVYLFQMLFLRTAAIFVPYKIGSDDTLLWWLTFGIGLPLLWGLGIGLYYGVTKPILRITKSLYERPASL
jgi:peptidoglycan/LPS O-acetylase OafA/YrhL